MLSVVGRAKQTVDDDVARVARGPGASDRGASVWCVLACHGEGSSAARAIVAVLDAHLLRASRETRRLMSPSVTICAGAPSAAGAGIQNLTHFSRSANSSRFATCDC